jgi:hypothetical protein
MVKRTILIIDDEKDFCMMVKKTWNCPVNLR